MSTPETSPDRYSLSRPLAMPVPRIAIGVVGVLEPHTGGLTRDRERAGGHRALGADQHHVRQVVADPVVETLPLRLTARQVHREEWLPVQVDPGVVEQLAEPLRCPRQATVGDLNGDVTAPPQ